MDLAVPADDDAGIDLQAAVVSLESSASDGKMLLRLLVSELGEVLGDRLTVERSGGGFRKKSSEIKRISIRLGDEDLEAIADGPSINCTIGHSSGGIRIRSEKTEMSQWLSRLLSILSAEAQRSQATRQALENIVIGKMQ